MNKKIIYIKGMHCVACEKLLKDEFDAVEGVIEARVDRKTDSAEIFFNDAEPDFAALKKVARKYGYNAFETKEDLRHEMSQSETNCSVGWRAADWTEWLRAVLVLIAILFIYRIFKNLGFLDKLDIQSSNVTWGVAFLTGLVASVSTCLVVVGSVVIAFGEKYKSEDKGFLKSALLPNLKFHLGRLISFFVLGGALGMIGGELNISGQFYFIFNITIAIVMFWLGLNILGILPSISNLGVKMPKIFSVKWDELKKSEHKAAPFFLGALSFFLPCGFTQSMQIFALASGSFMTGAFSLLLFALGTMPALFALGITVSWTQNQRMTLFQKVAGFLIIIFAVYTFNSGLALKDVRGSVLSVNKNQEAVNIEQDTADDQQKQDLGEQIIKMKLTYDGYEPSVLKIKKGLAVKWIINAEQISGCTNNIIVPSLDISQDLKKGENIIRFVAPDKAGTLNFSCWMGMVRGKFIVE